MRLDSLRTTDANLRALDRQYSREFAEALWEDVRSLQPDYSVAQVAAFLSRGADDPYTMGEKTLYACSEGMRKFPPHKIGLLSLLATAKRTARVVAQQAGLLVYDPPAANQYHGPEDLRAVMRRFSEMLDAHCEGVSPHGPGGEHLTQGENDAIQDAASKLIEAVLTFRAACNESTQRGMVTPLRRAQGD